MQAFLSKNMHKWFIVRKTGHFIFIKQMVFLIDKVSNSDKMQIKVDQYKSFLVEIIHSLHDKKKPPTFFIMLRKNHISVNFNVILYLIIIIKWSVWLNKEYMIYCILGNIWPCFMFAPFALVVWMNFKDWENFNVSIFFTLYTTVWANLRWGKTICK